MHVDDGPPLLEAHVEEEAVAHDAGVVHDAIDAAERIDRCLHDPGRAVGFSDAVGAGDGLAAGRLDFRDDLLGRARLAVLPGTHVVDDDLGAIGGEGEREIAPDPGA